MFNKKFNPNSEKNLVLNPFFNGSFKKTTISTTLPTDVYTFAKKNNLKFSYLLTKSIQEIMGGEFLPPREELQEKLRKMILMYERLTNYLFKKLGEENFNKIMEDIEYLNRATEKLDKNKGIEKH